MEHHRFRTYAESHLNDTACRPGAAAGKAAANKPSKYRDLADLFFPVAVETDGTWNQMSVKLIQEIGLSLRTRGNQCFVPAPVHCPSTRKCGLLPQHLHCQRIITHCNRFLLNFLVAYRLFAGRPKIIIAKSNKGISCSGGSAVIPKFYLHVLPNGTEAGIYMYSDRLLSFRAVRQ